MCVAIREPAPTLQAPDAGLGVGRIGEALVEEVGLGVGGYFFFWALLVRAARSLPMPFLLNGSNVSLFLIECIFSPGISM